MPRLKVADVARICSGRLVGDGQAEAETVVADSREVAPGTAFAAVRGGHEFVSQASERGAPFLIVDRADVVPAGTTAVVVRDVVAGLAALASERRARLDVRVVAITGSVGKTLTKDLVAAALGSMMRVHAAPRSYNTDVGVPLVVLSCPEEVDVLVCELGARHPGEIAELCEIVRPEIGVVTGIGVTHLAEFGSRGAIARTKAELLAMLPADGVAVVASDDDYLDLLAASTHANLVTVGPGGHVGYGAERIDGSGRTHGWVRLGADRLAIGVPVAGRALVRNAAMAVTVASRLGVAPSVAAASIADARTTAWRMQITSAGGLVIVNDAWNANPTSVASALRSVRELAGAAEAWTVLGEMAELGPIATAAHERVGRLAAALGYTGVIAIGEAAAGVAAGAGGIAHRVSAPEEAAGLVASRAAAGAFVLVKASRAVELYETFPDQLTRARGRVSF